MIRKTRQVSSVVKSVGSAKVLSFNSFGIMGAWRGPGKAQEGNPAAGPGVKRLEEKTMSSLSPGGRHTVAVPAPGCLGEREEGAGAQALVRPR
jgi:hypothetical protein